MAEKKTELTMKDKIGMLWKKGQDNVNPVIAWSVFGGVFALSVVLALICWL